MELAIRNPVATEEIDAWSRAATTSLLGNPYDDDFRRSNVWRRNTLVPERVWGAQDRGRWVATLATQPRRLTVPGADGLTNDLNVDAVTGVGVSATHRRRGLLRRMITDSLSYAHAHDEPLSMLIAAEWPIYGRYGYAPAVWSADYIYRPRDRGAAVAGDPATMRQIDPPEVVELAPAIFDAFRTTRAGQVDRSAEWWARRVGQGGYEPSTQERSHWFVHDGPSGPDGLLSWKVTRSFDLKGNLGAIAVEDLATASDTAYRDMVAYLSGIDVISEIALPERAVDEPLRWLLDDGRALKQSFTGDWVWIRLLDTAAALAARTYSAEGRLVIDVDDTDGAGYGAGRFMLDGSPAGATCSTTTRSADLRISQRALASAYLGGLSLRSRLIAGGIEEITTGALGRLDAMLRTPLAPSNCTGF